MRTTLRRLALPSLLLAGLLALGSMAYVALWQSEMSEALRPSMEISERLAFQRRSFEECQKAANAQKPRDPEVLAIRAASCLSIRFPDEARLSPSVASLALASLSSAAARATLSGQSPKTIQELASDLAERASAQGLLDERALLIADAQVQALCLGPRAALCRLSGVDPARPWGPAASERLIELHKLQWRSERPDLALAWLAQAGSSAQTETDPAERAARERLAQARAKAKAGSAG